MVDLHNESSTSLCPYADDANKPAKHRLLELFWKLGPAFMRWAESHMTDPKLTPQRVRIMVHLKERGPVKMSDLRDALGVTATNITALVDALEKDGMVVRSAHSTDRRATMVSITDYAHEFFSTRCGDFKDNVAELFTVFNEQEQVQLAELLTRMRDALVDRGVLEPAHSVTKEKEKEST